MEDKEAKPKRSVKISTYVFLVIAFGIGLLCASALYVEATVCTNPYGRYCYVLGETDDKVILVVYYDGDFALVKQKTEYTLKNGVVDSVDVKSYYRSVATACNTMYNESVASEYNRKMNVLHRTDVENKYIGSTKDDLMVDLVTLLSIINRYENT